MLKNKKSIMRAAALCILVSLVVSMAACVRQGGAESTEPSAAERTDYTIEVTAEGGAPIPGLGIYVYEDSSMQELVWFAKTDDMGRISFTDKVSDSYVAVLAEVPVGYTVQEMYTLTGELTRILLPSSIASADELADVKLNLGDAMLDFSVTAPDGTEYTLSGLLAEKEAVVLNFWYLECQPCKNEFPYLQAAYESYSDKIEVLALNPINTDDAAIAALQAEMGLTFPMAQCDSVWAQVMQLAAYPTTVVIDRTGTISFSHTGSITEDLVFESIFDYFASEDYDPGVVQNLEDIPMLEAPGSNEDSPIEIGGFTSMDITVEPGQLIYYNIYKVTNAYLSIRNSDAYVIYNGTTYDPRNGVVGLSVSSPDTYTPFKIAFGNSGKETVTYTVTLSVPQGSFNNPYPMSLGEFTTKVSAGNDQGIYYSYTAEADGVLTLECLSISSNVPYDYMLYNLNTYAVRTLAADGSRRSVSIKVNAGDTVKITIATLPDSSNYYPAATFTSLATFTEGELEDEEDDTKLTAYTITVTDENRAPISGVYLYVDVDGTPQAITTNDSGTASVKLETGTYKVTLAVPGGYTARTTEYRLTDARPSFSIKLDTYNVEMAVYTVRTVDESGKPVAGTLVSIGSSFGYTDETGCVRMELEKGDYTVVIAAPEGYSCETPAFTYPAGTAELVVTLKMGDDSDSAEKLTYSVKVVNYDGTPRTGVTVQFLKDGTPVALKAVDSSGTAAVKLAEGTYTVALSFSGESMYYDASGAVLTQTSTSAVITVIPGVTGEMKSLYVGDAWYVFEGATYVTMQADLTNYYIFEPQAPGMYRIGTSDPSAVLSFWGSSTAFINLQPDMTAQDNTITLNVKESNLGSTYIIGITGAPDCVLEIVRIGDAVLDDSDIVPEVWQGEATPTAPCKVTGVSGKTLTYLDLTADGYTLVYNASDGYYHLNSAGGPILYVNLGESAPYVSMYKMLGFTGFGGTSLSQAFYDTEGNVVRKEDYTECMSSYVSCIDTTYGVYPLNDDLIYMLRQGGDYKGWWDSDNGNYLFTEVEGLNTDIAWMFAVCCFS